VKIAVALTAAAMLAGCVMAVPSPPLATTFQGSRSGHVACKGGSNCPREAAAPIGLIVVQSQLVGARWPRTHPISLERMLRTARRSLKWKNNERRRISEAALAAAERRGVKLRGDRGARLTAKQREAGRAALQAKATLPRPSKSYRRPAVSHYVPLQRAWTSAASLRLGAASGLRCR
jgi:hypothetical protein